MISVAEARERILSAIRPTGAEEITVAHAVGRVLAQDVAARTTHPPANVSAMDGYALRAADVAQAPASLRVVGESAAGRGFAGRVEAGQAARIFTGAPVPEGADAVVMQENTRRDGDAVEVLEGVPEGHFIRPAGLDFAAGEALLTAGKVLGPRDIGLAAAMNHAWLRVRRRPRVAILSTGDEIKRPGDPLGPHDLPGSNSLALAAFVIAHGGEPIDLGVAADTETAVTEMATGARGADLLVTSGGASVGDYDLVQSALGPKGLEVDFWKIAMRPGKPLMFGRLGEVPVLGLPGNPVSALVCALIFLGPVLRSMLDQPTGLPTVTARLTGGLSANDARQDHLRASLSRGTDGHLYATPFPRQDSAMLSRLAAADALVLRAPHAPAAQADDPVEVIPLEGML